MKIMKNAFSLKINWCLLFLFCSVLLFGQQHSLNFQVKQGITNFKNLKRDYSGSEKFNILGGDFSIGFNYRYSFFKEKYFTGSVGVLWNHFSFSKRIISRTNYWINAPSFYPYEGYENTDRFQTHSINFPIAVKTQVRKIGFSLGLISRVHLSSKLFYENLKKIKNAPLEYDLLKITYEAGETISDSPLNSGREQRAYLKNKMDIQYLFGVEFFLHERMSFELEYRNLIYDNYFIVASESYTGLKNGYVERYEFSLGTISIGVNCRIF